MKKMKYAAGKSKVTRRDFLKTSAAAAAGAAIVVPSLVPACATGSKGPNDRINIGVIGTGRIAQTMDIRDIQRFDEVQVIAVCDVDAQRMREAKKLVEDYYAKKQKSGLFSGCTMYGDYRELLAQDDIDAVMICTPDHWHALPAVAAAKAGKDIFIQKPLTPAAAWSRPCPFHRT